MVTKQDIVMAAIDYEAAWRWHVSSYSRSARIAKSEAEQRLRDTVRNYMKSATNVTIQPAIESNEARGVE